MRKPATRSGIGATDGDIMWPFVYFPMLTILVIHVGVRIPWFFGLFTG